MIIGQTFLSISWIISYNNVTLISIVFLMISQTLFYHLRFHPVSFMIFILSVLGFYRLNYQTPTEPPSRPCSLFRFFYEKDYVNIYFVLNKLLYSRYSHKKRTSRVLYSTSQY